MLWQVTDLRAGSHYVEFTIWPQKKALRRKVYFQPNITPPFLIKSPHHAFPSSNRNWKWIFISHKKFFSLSHSLLGCRGQKKYWRGGMHGSKRHNGRNQEKRWKFFSDRQRDETRRWHPACPQPSSCHGWKCPAVKRLTVSLCSQFEMWLETWVRFSLACSSSKRRADRFNCRWWLKNFLSCVVMHSNNPAYFHPTQQMKSKPNERTSERASNPKPKPIQ